MYAMLVAGSAPACDVPVFRYALERWPSDVYVATVFHRGGLSDTDAAAFAVLREQTIREGGAANFDLRLCDVGGPLDRDEADLWAQQPHEAPLPRLVLRSPFVKGSRLVVWTGVLNEFNPASIFHSPARTRLAERLLAGDSVVWLVFTPAGDAPAEQVALLTRELDRLGNELPLPDGIGLPGSEVYSDVPLTLRFSVLTVESGDSQEQFLESALRAFGPDAAPDEPFAVPVYGRGRALAVIPLAQVNLPLIEDLSRFLSGPCSCQVKEQNPGFDLPLAVDWEARLFGENIPPPAEIAATPAADGPAAALVAIPPGSTGSPPTGQTAPPPPTAMQGERVNPLGVILFAVAACALLWGVAARRAPSGDRETASTNSGEL